ncbi:MAG: 30S ribosomal protein S8 [Microgenomates group bacterium GW2011_GWC1_41_8]|uniref:Small ribosomal subunit protein uS8 n=3 Tax=Candidatus Roizmaniibacteriota TaxID=1752723 RepID=A0A0G0TD05_9BACT|nr:MAG: 30S ribosomal protein S8 [Candidatus Roizmanbacteria bacterium GW2011_GWB1_40_7]KKR94566.1 MAG: 30S ribosomal protein S8 [Candidatus Roizmanbacteria bacterium GW2011_GWA1_41_13]KKS24254.1 MAG: 30S ribosomal protein S8 [Microgenomates group bacterium GW2011_GWC1_41_8]
MVNDPIGDLLTHIRNGYMAGKQRVVVPHSKLKVELANIFERKGYIKRLQVKSQVSKSGKSEQKVLEIDLKYTGTKPAMENAKRVSKPGRKIYVDKDHIPSVLSGYGTAVISTSKGLLTDKEARKQGMGGELICQIW